MELHAGHSGLNCFQYVFKLTQHELDAETGRSGLSHLMATITRASYLIAAWCCYDQAEIDHRSIRSLRFQLESHSGPTGIDHRSLLVPLQQKHAPRHVQENYSTTLLLP